MTKKITDLNLLSGFYSYMDPICVQCNRNVFGDTANSKPLKYREFRDVKQKRHVVCSDCDSLTLDKTLYEEQRGNSLGKNQ